MLHEGSTESGWNDIFEDRYSRYVGWDMISVGDRYFLHLWLYFS